MGDWSKDEWFVAPTPSPLRGSSPPLKERGDLSRVALAAGGAQPGASFNIGVMNASGGNVRILTDGWQDEGPSWAPNGQFVMFNRLSRGGGSSLYAVPVDGGPARRMPTPQDGSDPSWSPLQS